MEAVREWGPIPLILTSFNFSKLLNDSHEKGQHDWSGGWIKSSIFVSIYYVSVYIYIFIYGDPGIYNQQYNLWACHGMPKFWIVPNTPIFSAFFMWNTMINPFWQPYFQTGAQRSKSPIVGVEP